jgi:hypothetical protein
MLKEVYILYFRSIYNYICLEGKWLIFKNLNTIIYILRGNI